MVPILEVILATLTVNTSVITLLTFKGLRNIPSYSTPENTCRAYTHFHHHVHNMAPKLPQYFYLLMEKPIGCSFHVHSPYYQATQCSQKTYTCILNETRLTTSQGFQCHGDISQFQPSKFTSAVGSCRGF